MRWVDVKVWVERKQASRPVKNGYWNGIGMIVIVWGRWERGFINIAFGTLSNDNDTKKWWQQQQQDHCSINFDDTNTRDAWCWWWVVIFKWVSYTRCWKYLIMFSVSGAKEKREKREKLLPYSIFPSWRPLLRVMFELFDLNCITSRILKLFSIPTFPLVSYFLTFFLPLQLTIVNRSSPIESLYSILNFLYIRCLKLCDNGNNALLEGWGEKIAKFVRYIWRYIQII